MSDSWLCEWKQKKKKKKKLKTKLYHQQAYSRLTDHSLSILLSYTRMPNVLLPDIQSSSTLHDAVITRTALEGVRQGSQHLLIWGSRNNKSVCTTLSLWKQHIFILWEPSNSGHGDRLYCIFRRVYVGSNCISTWATVNTLPLHKPGGAFSSTSRFTHVIGPNVTKGALLDNSQRQN